jgi:hypothetical protein
MTFLAYREDGTVPDWYPHADVRSVTRWLPAVYPLTTTRR